MTIKTPDNQERFDFVCAHVREKAYVALGDVWQFIQMGFPLLAILGEMLGKNAQEMKTWIEGKKVGLADFEKALAIIETRYAV